MIRFWRCADRQKAKLLRVFLFARGRRVPFMKCLLAMALTYALANQTLQKQRTSKKDSDVEYASIIEKLKGLKLKGFRPFRKQIKCINGAIPKGSSGRGSLHLRGCVDTRCDQGTYADILRKRASTVNSSSGLAMAIIHPGTCSPVTTIDVSVTSSTLATNSTYWQI